jgi:predicted CoA-binding protein
LPPREPDLRRGARRARRRPARDLEEPVDLVDVFRRPEHCPGVAHDAAAIAAPALWLQLGIFSDEARRIAGGAGMDYVENACTAVVHRFL